MVPANRSRYGAMERSVSEELDSGADLHVAHIGFGVSIPLRDSPNGP